ncbi:DUF5590 domain-containing protein [Ornithinibacillus scapharcae]|uniref:cell wall elongation regulator TseB-like domain-containing protein n=1 Tax=Ornithinibacillus scapharcae TaxID=1147159 RepID=UPI000225BA1F|nr:DUF5590 domain-containing protein [Ornithinibacillus scapharcae]
MMMYKKNTETTSWLKWVLLGLLLLLIITLIYLFVLYQGILESKTKNFSDAEQRVIQETDVNEIISSQRFQGDSLYTIVTGKTDDEEDVYVFVPEKAKEDIVVVEHKEVLPAETVQESWQNSCTNCDLIHIVPAIIKNDPVWEITYIDETDRYVLSYVSIYDGSQYEEFRFKKTFE